MPCFNPLRAFKTSGGDVVFLERSMYDIVQTLSLPCGQCIGCRLERSRQWAMRCLHEASLHKENAFITLTYDDANLPTTGSLFYDDYQLFMKRLRRHAEPIKPRFYMCGEYGEETFRPHYHACIFGYNFPDLKLLKKTAAGSKIYTSEILAKLWPHGLSSIGDVNFDSAAYVARYCMKKVTGDAGKHHYRRYSTLVDDIKIDMHTGEIYSHELVPEFNKMSLKPGIGANWYNKFKGDVYPHDYVIINGKEVKPPKYYDKLYSRDKPEDAEYVLHLREMSGRARYSDNTPERLDVKQQIAEARTKLYHRS